MTRIVRAISLYVDKWRLSLFLPFCLTMPTELHDAGSEPWRCVVKMYVDCGGMAPLASELPRLFWRCCYLGAISQPRFGIERCLSDMLIVRGWQARAT